MKCVYKEGSSRPSRPHQQANQLNRSNQSNQIKSEMASIRSNRRTFLSRIGINRVPRYDEFPAPYSPPYSPTESFTLRLSVDDDTESIHSVLPPYSPRSCRPAQFPLNRPPSPAPSYHSVVGETPPTSPLPMMTRFTDPQTQPTPSASEVVDEIITRLRANLKNPKQWRRVHTGESSFFWALRCNAGTADVILDDLEHIKDKVLDLENWRVEKFCLIFKGQKLGDLLCRPIQTSKYGTHTEPLKDDYFVVHVFKA